MKKILIVALVALSLCPSCRKHPVEMEKTPEAASPTVPGETPAWKEPPVTTENLRRAFNETAAELFDFRWSADRGTPGKVDVEAGDLSIPPALRDEFGIKEGKPSPATPELLRAVGMVEEDLERKRAAAVRAALSESREVHLHYDLSTLPDPERKAAAEILDSGYSIEMLYRLQNHPQARELERKLAEGGGVDSIRFYHRLGGPVSRASGASLFANALRDMPGRMIGAVMWPAEMNGAMFSELATLAGANTALPFLSPTTVVKKNEAGEFIWMPCPAYPPFGEALRSVARRLEDAAGVAGIDGGFAKQMKSQAAALTSREPSPFATGAMIPKSGGSLETIVGAYDTDRDPYLTKAFYTFVLAADDPSTGGTMGILKPLIPDFEAGIAQMAPRGTYGARAVDPDPPIRAVDVIMAKGYDGGEDGPRLAAKFPCAGGAWKSLIFVNHHEAMLPIIKGVAASALAPDASALVDLDSFVLGSLLAEITGPLGPQKQTKVPSGATVAESLGRNFETVFIARGDALAAWAAGRVAARGMMGADRLARYHATYIADLVRAIAFGRGAAKVSAARAELAYLAWHGGIKEQGGKISIIWERIGPAIDQMLAELIKVIATGNADGAAELSVAYPERAPAVFTSAVENIRSQNIPRNAAVTYHVAGR